jgi:Tol biopolymer transport system component
MQTALRLTDGDWNDADPEWSPDGTRITFVSARHDSRDTDATRDLWTIPAAGGPFAGTEAAPEAALAVTGFS